MKLKMILCVAMLSSSVVFSMDPVLLDPSEPALSLDRALVKGASATSLQDETATPLQRLAMNCQAYEHKPYALKQKIDILIDAGSSALQRDEDGRLPFHIAQEANAQHPAAACQMASDMLLAAFRAQVIRKEQDRKLRDLEENRLLYTLRDRRRPS